MQNKPQATIITPTYNRLKNLKQLYSSLKKQSEKCFQWLVVDDGSNDGTSDWMGQLASTDFYITYVKKDNGGKHRALNYSHPYVLGDIVMIVDSDDTLTEDAVKTILEFWDKYKDNSQVLMVFQRGTIDENHKQFDQKFPGEPLITTLIELTNRGMMGDHCEVTTKKEFLKYNFPEYENEKFIGEAWLWQHIGKDGPTIFVNRVVYLCNYLDGGLTKSGRKMRALNPKGGREHAKIFLSSEYTAKIRIKNAILYNYYNSFIKDEKANDVKQAGINFLLFLTYIPGKILKLIWN